MALIGYARVSTQEQSLDRQIKKLEEAGCIKIFSEKISGTKENLPQLSECMKYIRPQDVLVVDELNRLGRQTLKLLKFINRLQSLGIEILILSHQIDTRTPMGRAFIAFSAMMAQLERDLISERTKGALERARARGRLGGRKAKLDEPTKMMVWELSRTRQRTIQSIANTFNVSRITVYKVINNMKAKLIAQGADTKILQLKDSQELIALQEKPFQSPKKVSPFSDEEFNLTF